MTFITTAQHDHFQWNLDGQRKYSFHDGPDWNARHKNPQKIQKMFGKSQGHVKSRRHDANVFRARCFALKRMHFCNANDSPAINQGQHKINKSKVQEQGVLTPFQK